MKRGPIKDLPTSVWQRLLNNSRATERPFQEVLQYFVMERFLYRLSRSPCASRFILKGALMFSVWGAPRSRPTKDIDLLARMDNSPDAVISVVCEICNQPVEPDGLVFNTESVACVATQEDAEYEGLRVTFLATIQNARLTMRLDMGFGDVVTPAATLAEYPTILDFPAPFLLGYNRETAVAEKFEAMVKYGHWNSRLKDFYDIWLLSREYEFDGPTLAKSVSRTFAHRKTNVDPHPLALTVSFANDPEKQAQWKGFLRKSRLKNAPEELPKVIDDLVGFLLPIAANAKAPDSFKLAWAPAGPWRIR